MRRLLLLLLILIAIPLHAAVTPAEKLANDAAQHELDSSPASGNIPSYSLKPADLAKAQHLEKIGTVLHFGEALWSLVCVVALLALGVVGLIRDEAMERFRNRWLQTLYFLFLLGVIAALLDLPLAVYSQHLRLQYGLSVQSWSSWFGDQLKSGGIILPVGTAIVRLLFWLIGRFPKRWWFGFWIVSIPITLIGLFVTPYIVDPLFNTFEPMQKSHPELVQRLEEVANRGHMNIPPDRMFLMKASDKVTTLNAYVTGFGASKRVVVWDTSIAQGTPDDILFIFAHESGHYVLNHVVIGVLFSTVLVFVTLFLGYHFVQWAIRRFGAAWRIPSQNDLGALVVLLLGFALLSFVLEPITCTFSRSSEHAADVYGMEAVHGIVSNPQETARGAFQVLGETSYDVPNPSQFMEFWTYSHPSIGRRAAFTAHYNPWADGYAPKYFPKQ